jgi:signal transduction histidine kinase
MSTTDLTEVPAEVLRQWPGRWRYPVLAVALASDDDEVRADVAAKLVLQGLADPRTPEQIAADFVANGEFGLIDDLSGEADLPRLVIESLDRTLESARGEVATQVRDRIFELRRRAQQAGTEFPADDDQLMAVASMRSGSVLAELAAREHSISVAERQCAEKLSRLADAKLAAFDGDGLAWRDAVRACLDSREFAVARNLIEAGPSVLPADRALSVPRPRSPWPFQAFPLAEILTWYEAGQPAPAAGFEHWRPNDDDEAAARLIDTLRGLADNIGPHSVLDFALALHALIGADEPDCRIKQIGQGVLTSLHIPASDPLPDAPLTSHPGAPLWVGDPGDLPPEDLRPLIWFVPATRVAEFTPWGIARLDATDLLRLLRPSGTGDVTRHRRVNLLRAVASRLPADEFLGQVRMPHPPAESEVDWLLDLAGIRPDAACLQAIQHESAEQPVLLRKLLVRLADEPRPGEPRRQRLSLSTLNRVRHSAEWRQEALSVLQLPLRHDYDAQVLLRVVTAFYHDPGTTFTTSQLEQDLEGTLTAEAVRGAAGRLAADRLLQRAGHDEFRLPANRVGELLTQSRAEEALEEAAEAIAELKAVTGGSGQADADKVVHFVGHQVDGYLAGIQTELADVTQLPRKQQEPRIYRASAYARDASGVYRKYRQALGGVVVCDLLDLLQECSVITESLCAGAVRVPVTGPKDVRVRANRWLLRESFKAILDNSRLEILTSGQPRGTISVLLRHDAAGPPDGLEDEARPWALTTIDDNGPGLDQETYDALTGGARQGIRPRGQGTGLDMARQWFAAYGGCLSIQAEAGQLKGAQMRVWLPLHDR